VAQLISQIQDAMAYSLPIHRYRETREAKQLSEEVVLPVKLYSPKCSGMAVILQQCNIQI